MTETIFSWLCSLLSIAMIWKMGDRSLWGPSIGLVAQASWTGFMIAGGHWGLAPAVIGFTLVHVRNLVKWRRITATQNTPASAGVLGEDN